MISDAKFERLMIKHFTAFVRANDNLIRDWQLKTGKGDDEEIKPDKNLLALIGVNYFKMISILDEDIKAAESNGGE